MSKLVLTVQTARPKEVIFESLKVGEVFFSGDTYYIKFFDDDLRPKAMALNSFIIHKFDSEEIVVPVESAVLDIKK